MVERKLVYVEWTDSRVGLCGWQPVEDVADAEPCRLRSIGWVVKETASYIHLAPHIGDDPEQACGYMVIPKVAIIKREIVRIGGSKRVRYAAAKVLRNPKLSKAAKTAKGSALTQRKVKPA